MPESGILAKLNPCKENHHNWYVGRDKDEEEIINLIEFNNKIASAGAIAICGSVACGKSTLTKFITHRIQNNNYKTSFDAIRIDLDHFNGEHHSTSVRSVNSWVYIDFFSEIENIIVKSVKPEDLDKTGYTYLRELPKLQPFDLFGDFETKLSNDDLELISEIIGDSIKELAKKAELKKPLALFIDNLDKLPTHELFILLSVFRKISTMNNQIRVVFTARPVSIEVVKYIYTDILRGTIADNYHLKSIKIEDIYLSRLNNNTDFNYIFSPIVIKHVQDIYCGDIDKALQIMKTLIFEHSKKPVIFSNTDEFHVFLFLNEHIHDIFLRNDKADRVPKLLLLLVFLRNEKKIDRKFLKNFNNLIIKARGKKVDQVNIKELEHLVSNGISKYLIRRCFLHSDQALKEIYQNRDSISDASIALTRRGLTTLKKLDVTLKNSLFFPTYAKSVQNYVKGCIDKNFNNYQYIPENPNMRYRE